MARLGRTGLVLTDLPPFIVAGPADRQLAPAPAPGPSGCADEIGKIRIGFEDNAGQIKRSGSGRGVREKPKKEANPRRNLERHRQAPAETKEVSSAYHL